MNNQKLGEEIVKLRKQHFLSQKQLAEGICSQSAISQIERGQIFPGVDTLYNLSAKLHVPIDYFIQLMLEDDMDENEDLIAHVEHLSGEQKFEQMYGLLKGKLDESINCYWMTSYLTWHFHLSAYQTKRVSIEKTIQLLKDLHDEKKTPVQSKGNLRNRILNSIAYLLATNGQYKESLYYYDKILKNEDRSSAVTSVLTPDIFTIRVMYNKSKTLYDMGASEESLATIEDGIKKSLEKENMSLLGQFYYYRGQCFERLGSDEDEIRECYQKALFIFELLDKKLYSRLLWKYKESYLK
ncbi:helix-turn-helix domain-containing protein [Alteribacter keqinensis]|uniref:XRE family transcriptional regulator n=1 Tax=Alteribacter keqinensis TaxID=2483800 RepID=A0A3M7TX44_9BACI|nr:helix-turn-helix domain-containing protein [Alteribacter keqinensis]RNA70178.1 XRE family transcriptional regulator [Alteribacter keqinensis]